MAWIRVLSVSLSATGIARVVLEFASKDRFGGRPGTRGQIEFNFETQETNTARIGDQARRRLVEQLGALDHRVS